MIIAGFTMATPWASRAIWSGTPVQEIKDVMADMKVSMDTVFFSYETEQMNYRPRLHMRGRLLSIIPLIDMPSNITEITFDPESGPIVEGYYSFTDEQLASLVHKGYFNENFDVPALFSESVWELPTTLDALYVTGDPEKDIPPAIFVDVHNRLQLSVDMTNSGYDLSEQFLDQRNQSFDQVANPVHSVDTTGVIFDDGDMFVDDILGVDDDKEKSHETMVAGGFIDSATGKLTPKAGLFRDLLNSYALDDDSEGVDEVIETNEPESVDEIYASLSSSINESLKSVGVTSLRDSKTSHDDEIVVTESEDIDLGDDISSDDDEKTQKLNAERRARAIRDQKTKQHQENVQKLNQQVSAPEDADIDIEDVDIV